MGKALRSIVIGFLIVAVGLSMVLVGSWRGGGSEVFWHHGHFWVPQNKQIQANYPNIQSLDVQGDNLDITVKSNPKLKKGMQVTGHVTNAAGLSMQTNQQKLTLSYHDAVNKMPSFSDAVNVNEQVVIQVPANTKLQDVKLETISGDLTLKQVQILKLKTRNNFGQTSLQQTKGHQITLASQAGLLNFDRSQAKHLKLDSTTGLLQVHGAKLEQTQMHVVQADVNVTQSQLGQTSLNIGSGNTNWKHVSAQELLAQTGEGNYQLEQVQLHGTNFMMTNHGNITTKQLQVKGYRLEVQNTGVNMWHGQKKPRSFMKNNHVDDQVVLATYDGNITVNQ
ncbi:DUF4097 family beta strand repeat-containing protein [Weissella kandleri]|uniref:DUF4097 family beta strand repeat-containing protein n=1 Tax=Weissella kandleri TaxID=1616 RepID=UPI00387E29CF